MEMFSTVLAYGYLVIVGFIFLVMIVQIIAFYAAGRITGSINDEISSAFTLLGAGLVIGTASTLVNAVISLFLDGMMLPGLIAFILYVVAIIYSVVKIYELSIGKAIAHLFLSMIITAVLMGATIYLLTLTPILSSDKANDTAAKLDMLQEEHMQELADEEAEESAEALMGRETQQAEADQPSTPKLPGQTSDKSCTRSNDCESDDEACFLNTCYTKAELEKTNTTGLPNCGELSCVNCEGGVQHNHILSFGDGSTLSLCAECSMDSDFFACNDGYKCEDHKCVAN